MTNSEFSRELIRTKSILFSFALKLTRNYPDAQDLFQDAAVRAFRYCSRFEMGTNFRAWMTTIIRNAFINDFRAKRRRPLVDGPFEKLLLYAENKNVIANQGEINMRIQDLYKILNKLDGKYSVPFLMYCKGYDYKEIGQFLNLPMGTVKSRLYTARQTLQKMVKTSDGVSEYAVVRS